MNGDVMDTQLHENISALADGELATSEIELAFAALGSADGQAAWDVYHQIGHTLRSDSCGSELSGGFRARLAQRLALEPPQGQAHMPALHPDSDAVSGAVSDPVSDAVSDAASDAVTSLP